MEKLMRLDPSLPQQSWLSMSWTHFKNAFLVAIFVGGFSIALASEFNLRVAARVVCPPGADLVYEEFYDGESTVLSGYCLKPGEPPQEQTLSLVGVAFGMYWLAFFLPPMIAGITIRLIRKKDKSAE